MTIINSLNPKKTNPFDPIKIRAVFNQNNKITDIKILMPHVMDSGRIKDKHGNTIPEWHITLIQIEINQQLILSINCGTSLSKNPYMAFQLSGGQTGQTIMVRWFDNQGYSNIQSAIIR